MASATSLKQSVGACVKRRGSKQPSSCSKDDLKGMSSQLEKATDRDPAGERAHRLRRSATSMPTPPAAPLAPSVL
jgi:hypothetical protein